MARRYSFGPFLLDTARGTLTRDGAAVAVGQRALRVLQALLEAGGAPVTKADLMAQAWPGFVVEDSNLSVQVTALRKALAAAGVDGEAAIVTVPRLGYRLPGAVAVEESQLAPLDHGAVDHGGRPSIAVLPFAHLGDDPAQEYLADGVTEALIATLSRFRWFSVSGRGASLVYKLAPKDNRTVAAELGVRYLVEGTVRKSGPRLRISVQLVDAPAGVCLWADQVDVADADLFDVQDAIVQQVAGAIEPALLRNVAAAAGRRRGGMTAWSLVAQGTWLFHHVGRPTHLKARELFRQAARIDADLHDARLWIGRVNAGLVAYGWSDDPARDLQEGRAAALEAVQGDEQNPYAHYALAIVANYADDFAPALRSADKAIELNPSFALGHLVRGMALLFGGDAVRAAAALELGLKLNRHDPQNFAWYTFAALAFLFAGEPGRAAERAIAALKVRPAWRPALRSAAAAGAALGRIDERADWQRQWSAAPASADAFAPLWRHHPGWANRMEKLSWPVRWRKSCKRKPQRINNLQRHRTP
jgi:TolB-like protein